MLAVTLLAGIAALGQGTIAQYGRKASISKGPRALGLLQLFPNGKVHLIPVSVMMDGKFFDAASYKATPVPMALDFGVVYEGFRTGVSQGVFTVTQPGQAGHNWMAEGTWLAAGATPPRKGMKYEKPKIEDPDAPPRLHRGDAKPAPPAEKPAPPAPAKPAEKVKVEEPPPVEDPNRPVLRRGKPDPEARRELIKKFDAESSLKSGQIQIFPAISDAGGPDARPYAFDLQPAEQETYRKKMLDLAVSELRARRSTTPEPAGAKPVRKSATASRTPAPALEDVHLRIFDLTNSNEPILVFSAKTRPDAKSPDGEEITLVARTNLELEVQKLFFSRTDPRHFYIAPRMELIDAVDADGDGRGDLLFRTTTDTGSSYSIYRITADRLWPLYEGTP